MHSPLIVTLGTVTLSREARRKDDPFDGVLPFFDFPVEPVLLLVLRREAVEWDGEGSLVLVDGPACRIGVPGAGLSTAVVYFDRYCPGSAVLRGDRALSESWTCSGTDGSAAGSGVICWGVTASAAWSTRFISWS